MLLRIRVRLPDRPGSLGKVARTLGAAGADVVQMTVLESDAGRALDDFTVAWPTGVGIERLCEGLASISGVDMVGVWPTVEPQGAFPDAALIGQLATGPVDGLPILTDAVPAILSADWAALVRVGGSAGAAGAPPEHLDEHGDERVEEHLVLHTSLGAAAEVQVPDLHPLRPRAFTGREGTRYAVLPIAGGELALLVARVGAPPFHRTEVFRLAQLVSAAEAVIGSRLPADEVMLSHRLPAASGRSL